MTSVIGAVERQYLLSTHTTPHVIKREVELTIVTGPETENM
jgi:hypothetical protein